MNRVLLVLLIVCQCFASSALTQSKNSPPDSLQVAAWLEAAAFHVKTNVDSLRHYANLALKGARKGDLPKQRAAAHWYLGRAFDLSNASEEAAAEMERALEIYRTVLAPLEQARVMLDLSLVYFNLGQQDKATALLEEAMRMPEVAQDMDMASKIHFRAGGFYLALGQLEKGLEQHRLSLKAAKVVGKEGNISAGHNNIGNAFSALQQYDSAYHYYQLSLPYKEKSGDLRGLGATLNNLGNVLINLEKYAQGDSILGIAAENALKGGFVEQWIRIRVNQAYAKNKTQKFKASIAILEDLLDQTNRSTDSDLRIAIYGTLAESYRGVGRYEDAIYSLERHYFLKDSLSGVAANTSILELESKLNAEAKEREISLLAEKQRLQEVKLENRKVWIAVLISLALIVLLGTALLFQRFRRKQDAHQQLEALTQLRSRFFANISHEFRTPLSLLLGPLQKFNSDPEAATPDPELMKLMERNTRQLLDLNDQLLELSRLEAGKMSLEKGRLDLAPFLTQLGHAFVPLARERKVWLSIHVPEPAGWWAHADRNALTRIVNNLLSNALKHTPENGEVRFRAKINDSHGRDLESGNPDRDQWPQSALLRLSVSDTGRGIPLAEQSKIFERFHRVEGNTSEVPGTGIGLALVKEFVDLQDGEVAVESEPGKGSRFLVSLPVVLGWEMPGESVEDTDETETPPEGQGDLVLLVEDDPHLRQQMRESLGDSYRILEATDGKQGLELALEEVPDLLVTDWMMPAMNGLELCRALRADERSSHIPIVVLTAEASPEQKYAGLESGADDFLLKPVHPAELQLRIRNLLAQRNRLRAKWRAKEPTSLQTDSPQQHPENKFLQRAAETVDRFLDQPEFDVAHFAREMGLSRTQLFRKLKALTNQGPNEFVRNLRLQSAAKLLEKGNQNVSEVLFAVGFSSPSYFSRCFKQQFGVSPKDYAERSD